MPLTPSPRLRAFTVTILVLGSLAGAPSAPAQQTAPVPAVDTSDRQAVVDHYHAHYMVSVGLDPGWTGSVSAGVSGTLHDSFRAGALRRINYFRTMTGASGDIALDPTGNDMCQQAALMMAAQQNISHAPPATWKFYTAAAATACANSDIRLDWQGDEGALAIDRYVADDEDNNSSVGHRRWLLFPAQETMAVGAVPGDGWTFPGTNATWVTTYGARPVDAPSATAWPPAGYVPAPLVFRRWSYSHLNADFSNSTVNVAKNGVALAVVQEAVQYQTTADGGGMMEGDNTLVWSLPGNAVDASTDETYEVTVANVRIAGASQTVRYTVTSLNPDAVGVSLTAERDVAYQGGKKGKLVVTRTGNVNAALTVAYTVDGTATPGNAYRALRGTVTIPAGSASARIKVVATAGQARAVGKTVVVTLQNGMGYVAGGAASATVTIQAAP